VITVHQPDGLGFSPYFEHLRRSLERQVFDQHDDVAIREHVIVSVFDDACGRGLRGYDTVPFVPTGDTFPSFRVVQDFIHLTHRACRLAHREAKLARFLRELKAEGEPGSN
jgi:hypothetical protein